MSNEDNKFEDVNNTDITTNEDVNDKPNNKKKKKSIFPKILIGFCVFIALITSSGYYYLNSFSNNAVDLSKLGSGGSEKNNQDSSKESSKQDETGEIKVSTNFLILGTDQGSGNENNKKDPRNSDTMIVVHYNKETKKYDLISIPRDTKIETNRIDKKINSAYRIGQVPLAVKTVEELLGIKIDHYVKIDTIAYRAFIDAIGGIDVVIDRNMDYDDPTQNLHIHFKKSDTLQHLDGKKAEEYVRWRKNNNGTGYLMGDIDRIKNMQKFFGTVVNKIQSPAIIPKIPSVLAVFPKYMETDLEAGEILQFAMSVVKTPKENIKFHTLGGEPKYIDAISYYIYDKSKNAQVIAILKDIDPTEFPSFDTKSIRINIVNASSKIGLAKDFGGFISNFGFTNYVLNDGVISDNSKIILYGVNNEAGDYIKKKFGIENVEYSPKHNNNYEVEVILGGDRDFLNKQNKN